MSKWWWALAAFVLVAIIAGLNASYSTGTHKSTQRKMGGIAIDPYQHKAVSNVRQASLIAGGFSSYNSAAYAAGVQYAERQHQRLGGLTIIQVISMGQKAVDDQKKRRAKAASAAQPDCQGAFDLEKRAVRENKAGQYESAYRDSANGLVGAQTCPDNERVAAEAFLLSAGAFAEHYLGRDKDASDMNLALQKLEQCITQIMESPSAPTANQNKRLKFVTRRAGKWISKFPVPKLIRVAIKSLLLVCLSACQPYGCHEGFSTRSDAARDLAAFNAVLAKNPAFQGIKATAVHGH